MLHSCCSLIKYVDVILYSSYVDIQCVCFCNVLLLALQNADACARCHSAATCAAVHAVVDKGNAASSGMAPEQWSTLLGDKGVSAAAAAAWGAKWLQLIDWEEATARARKAELWALTGELSSE